MPSNCQVSHCPRANGDISETLVLSDQQRRPWKCLIYVKLNPTEAANPHICRAGAGQRLAFFAKQRINYQICLSDQLSEELTNRSGPLRNSAFVHVRCLSLDPFAGFITASALMSPRPEYKAPRRYRGFFLPGCSLFFF